MRIWAKFKKEMFPQNEELKNAPEYNIEALLYNKIFVNAKDLAENQGATPTRLLKDPALFCMQPMRRKGNELQRSKGISVQNRRIEGLDSLLQVPEAMGLDSLLDGPFVHHFSSTMNMHFRL